MRVIYGIDNLKKRTPHTAVCVGVFDSVHIGHRKIIKELVKQQALLKAEPAVVTFHPHPAKVLKGETAVAMLTSLKHRLRLLDELGVKLCIVINFNRAIAYMPAAEFIKKVLIDKLNMKMLIVGENFSFGKEKMHSCSQLRKIAEESSLRLTVIKSARYHSRIISSSLIRRLIEKGQLTTASKLLGRPVSILGTVIKGRQRGRTVGFRTANINPHHEAMPPSGVYAAYSKLGERTYKSVLNIGTRPTFGERESTVEVHLFGIKRNLYGEDIEIRFVKRLRPERRFKNKEHLRSQILKDAALARHIL